MNKIKTLIVLILVSLGAWVGVTNYMTPTTIQGKVRPVEKKEEEKMGVLPENGENARKLYGGGGGGGGFIPAFTPVAHPPPPPPLPEPLISLSKPDPEPV